MKYAILADIHANLAALKAVLADSKAQGCDHYICLGDLVGYGQNPRECLTLIRELDIPCIKGNHDDYCASEQDLKDFNSSAAEHIKWTRTQLTQDDKEWLSGLEYVKHVDGFTVVHATLDSPQRWGYVFNKLDAAASFRDQPTSVCFFGHTHVPLAFIRESTASGQPVVKGGTYSKFVVDPAKKYFVNPGSVGQPRDNNPKAAYATYDLNKRVIELRRLDYPRPDVGPAEAGAGVPVKPGPHNPPLTDSNHKEI